MEPSQKRSLRGPYVVAAFLALAAAGVVGGWLVLRGHPTPTRIVDILAVDADHAVVVRDVRGPNERSFVSLFGREHGELWGALIPPYAGLGNSHSAVSAAAGVVFVRSTGDGQPTFFAFSAGRGNKLGRIEPYADTRASAAGGFVLPSLGSLVGQGQVIEFSGVPGSFTSVLAFGLENGTLAWQLELGDLNVERAWLEPEHLVLAAPREAVIVRRQTGEVSARVPTQGPICVLEDELSSRDPERQVVMRRALARPDSAQPVPSLPGALAGPCGRTATHTVVAVDRAPGAALVALDRDGAVAWDLELAAPERGVGAAPFRLDAVALGTPDRSPLGGAALTRFVPVLAGPADGPAALLVIDTRDGRLARATSPSETLAQAHLMSADGWHYLYVPGQGILAAFDGATGELAAARAFSGFAPVWPRNIAGGHIWLARDTDFAVLDAYTLLPVPSAGLAESGRDLRAELAREFGW